MNARLSLRQQKLEVMQNLLGIIADATAAPEQRAAAGQSLRRIGDAAIVLPLAQVVDESQDESIIRECSEILSHLPLDRNARRVLTCLLWHDSPDVRHTVMASLARRGSQETAAVLAVLIADCKKPGSIFDRLDEATAKRARNVLLGRSI